MPRWVIFVAEFLYLVATPSHCPFCVRCTGFVVLSSQASESIYEMGRTTTAKPELRKNSPIKIIPYHDKQLFSRIMGGSGT